MTRRPVQFVALLAFIGLLAFAPKPHAAELGAFEGVFVGVSTDYDGEGHQTGERHVDMVIVPATDGGFEMSLVSVTLVDGRRDRAGVKRRAFTASFSPSETSGMYLADKGYDPFAEKTSSEMFTGEPLEWAQLKGDSLTIYSFAILEDGRYERQIFERTLDGDVMRTLYQRHLDGELQRQTVGEMVRSKD